jgi:glycerol-3-phosphate dehydrogenase (NAD(P)+)
MRSSPLPYPVRFGIIGGGAFSLAMGSVLARNNIPSTLLVRNQSVAVSINTLHKHPVYLSDIRLPNHIQATTDPTTALGDASHVIHSLPVQVSRKFLSEHGMKPSHDETSCSAREHSYCAHDRAAC